MPTQSECEEKLLGNTHPYYSSGIYSIPRMTPEIEYLVYSFLSNPIIRQSSESCSEYFWRDGNDGAPLYINEDMGEIIPEDWWTPY